MDACARAAFVALLGVSFFVPSLVDGAPSQTAAHVDAQKLAAPNRVLANLGVPTHGARRRPLSVSGPAAAIYVDLPSAARTLPFNATTNAFGSPIIMEPAPGPTAPPPLSIAQAVSVDGRVLYWVDPPATAGGNYTFTAYSVAGSTATAGATVQFPRGPLVFPGSAGASAYFWMLDSTGQTMSLSVYSADLTKLLGTGPAGAVPVAYQVPDPTSLNAYLVDTGGTFRVLTASGSTYAFGSTTIPNVFTPSSIPGTLSALAVTTDGTRAFTFSGSTLNVIDPHALRVVSTIALPHPAIWVGVNPSGTRVYVAEQVLGSGGFNSYYLSIIDAASGSILTTVQPFSGTSLLPGGIALTPDATRVLMAANQPTPMTAPFVVGTIYTIDATSGTTLATATPPPVSSPPETAQIGLILVPAGLGRLPERACGRCNGTTIGRPIDVATGEVWNEKTDLALEGPFGLSFTRFYGNQSSGSADLGGTNWTHNYTARLDVSSLANGRVTYFDFEGMPYYFSGVSAGAAASYDNLTGMALGLSSDGSTFTLTRFDSSQSTFNASGQLTTLRDRIGNTQTIVRDNTHANRIASVTDPLGRSLCFYYDANSRITSVAAWINTTSCPTSVPASSTTAPVVTLGYDTGTNCAQGDLCTVTEPDGAAWTYQYAVSDPNYPTNLIEVLDPLGDPEEIMAYSGNRAIHQESGKCTGTSPCADTGNDLTISYPGPGSSAVTVTDGVGRVSTITFDPTTLLLTQVKGAICGCGGDQTRNYTYDGFQRIRTVSDDGGDNLTQHTVTYTYGRDASGIAYPGPTTIAENLDAQGTTRTTSITYYPIGDPRQDLAQTTTDPSVDQPGQVVTTVDTYSATGLLTQRAQTGFVNGVSTTYTWKWTYDSRGRVLTETEPRTDVNATTTYVYFPDTDGTTARAGQLDTVTDALGHVVTFAQAAGFSTYDPFGDPLSMQDENSVVTQYAYDARGRLLTSTLLGVPGDTQNLVTQKTYDTAGRPKETILPAGNGSILSYDTSGRVIAVKRVDTSALKREEFIIGYNADDQPTSFAAQICPSPAMACAAWTTTWSQTYAYSPANSNLKRIINSDNTAKLFSYTSQGEVLTFNDENHASGNDYTYAYDAAGRRLSETRVLAGASSGAVTSSNTYDLHDNVASVTDANRNVTTYHYDDFDRMVKETSPTTGITTYAYDPDGNLSSTVNANGATTAYTYDALDRVLTESSTKGSAQANVTWSYDDTTSGHFGIGGLATMTDPSGSTAYTHDRRGNVTVENHLVEGASYSYSYGYDANGNRSSITYPDGKVVSYTFDFADRPFSVTEAGSGAGMSLGSTRVNRGLTAPMHAAQSEMPRYPTRPTVRLLTPMVRQRENQLQIPIAPASRPVSGRAARVGEPSRQVLPPVGGPSRTPTIANRRPLLSGASGTVLVASAAYLPFGPLATVVYGNGTTQTLSYDQRYLTKENLLSASAGTIADHKYTEDAVGNITGISDELDSGYSRAFMYDDLNRLTTANAGAKLWGTTSGNGYTYDAMGNMLSLQLGATRTDAFTYAVGTGSSTGLPLLTSVNENGSARNVSYDLIGSELSDSVNTFTYGARELLGSSQPNVSAYEYDGWRRRVYTQLPNGNHRVSLFDSEDNLLAESAQSPGTANIAYDYVWFEDRPVAQLDSSGTHWTFADHLGAPLVQTDANAVTSWQAEYEPYGKIWALRSGDVHQPLRLPGQSVDQFDTGANGLSELGYNIARWYRAGWGRYSQADQFVGSLEPYQYVDDDPTGLIDPSGTRPKLPYNSQRCIFLRQVIQNLFDEVNERKGKLDENLGPHGGSGPLPERAPGDAAKPRLSKWGHRKLLNIRKAQLAARRAEYDALCDDPSGPLSCPATLPQRASRRGLPRGPEATTLSQWEERQPWWSRFPPPWLIPILAPKGPVPIPVP